VTHYEDLQSIIGLPHRYCGGVNRADFGAVEACFTKESEWIFEAPGDDGLANAVRLQGGREVGNFVREAWERAQFIRQLIGVVDVVSVDGDAAHLFTDFEVRLRFRDGTRLYVIAMFDDHVGRFPEGWRFTQRVGRTVFADVLADPVAGEPAAGDGPGGPSLGDALRDAAKVARRQ
jgi:hypothetical protein